MTKRDMNYETGMDVVTHNLRRWQHDHAQMVEDRKTKEQKAKEKMFTGAKRLPLVRLAEVLEGVRV